MTRCRPAAALLCPGAALLALACAFAPACKRIGGGSARTAEELLPAQPPGAATTGPLAQVAQHASDLVARLSALPGGEQLGDTRKALAAQLGFDPLTRDGLLAAGIDPERGAAFLLVPPAAGPPGFVAVLPLSSGPAFVQSFEKLARERAGYADRSEEARGAVKAVVFSRPDGSRRLGYALVRGYAVVARTADPAADLAAAAARTPGESLAQDAHLASLRGDLGGPDLLLYAPAQGWLQARLFGISLPGDAGVGLSASGLGLHARAAVSLAPPDAHEISNLLVGGGATQAALLPKDAPVQLRLGLAPAQLPAELARIPRLRGPLDDLRRALAERKVDLDRDFFGALQPGAVASLSLSPRADLSRAVDGGALELRRNPFDLVQLAAFGRPSDEVRLRAALEAVSEVLPRFGAVATRKGKGESEWQVAYPGGGETVHFGLRSVEGAPLVYLTGGTTLDEVLAKKGARGAAGAEAIAAAVDLGELASEVSALPSSAYGKGPQSYVARSIVSQLIEPLRPLAVHGTLAAGPRGVTVDVSVDIARADAPQ